jgi:hypothetical protein
MKEMRGAVRESDERNDGCVLPEDVRHRCCRHGAIVRWQWRLGEADFPLRTDGYVSPGLSEEGKTLACNVVHSPSRPTIDPP